MKKSQFFHSHDFLSILFFVLLTSIFYSSNLRSNNASPLAGQQLAYFVGYHSGGINEGSYSNGSTGQVYYRPKYHYKGSYHTPLTYIGHTCRKTCLVDRWTGRSLKCYKSCQ